MLVLKASKLIDGTGRDPIPDAAILIDGERIRAVGPAAGLDAPPDAEVVDLGDWTLMPGLIDAHVHLMAFNTLTFKNYRVAKFEVPPQLLQMYGLLHAQMLLEMGFTTVRDEGWVNYAGVLTAEMVAVRDAINNGIFAGPRLKVAGWAAVTGSHLDMVVPGNAPRRPGDFADGPWELRKLVRANLRLHVDHIKTCVSGGGGTDKVQPDIQNMSQEELNAVVEEAHYFQKPVSAHCFTPTSQKKAVRAGVDTIEHCVFTDDEAIAMIKAENRPVVPTLTHRTDRSIESRRHSGAPDFVIEKMKRIQPHTRETFKRMHQAGVRIAMGTDVQCDPEMGANALELEIYVNYGMTPMEALLTATKNAAEALWLDKDTGTLEAGKSADVLAVEGNPLEDVRILQERDRIKMVLKEGRVYVDKRSGENLHVIHDQSYGWKVI